MPNIYPIDLMAIYSRFISKPGYSTFAEALFLEVPVVPFQLSVISYQLKVKS
ncbi:hypothetical protein [Dapis sp. BLCC M172]|uniref:hypothetical protein n=1 Tax=Dapis sp. BLCC M172 TaxID=2975281 RepID=UPI003CFB164D